MQKFWMRAGALGIAVGALGLVLVQAGLSSCGSARPAPESQSPEPPITTKASGAPNATSTVEQEEAPPEYMPATKSGSFLPRPRAQQKNSPAK